MLQQITDADQWLFKLINQKATASFFDQVALIIRQPLTWTPLYLFLLIYAVTRFQKKAWLWIFQLAGTLFLSDTISSSILKPFFGRIRPCNNVALANDIRFLAAYCGQNGSFPSSHACNHFVIAMFMFVTMREAWGRYNWLFFAWAALICYAQVYVGVHYPLDVLGGMLLGCSIGWISGKLFTKKCEPIKLK